LEFWDLLEYRPRARGREGIGGVNYRGKRMQRKREGDGRGGVRGARNWLIMRGHIAAED